MFRSIAFTATLVVLPSLLLSSAGCADDSSDMRPEPGLEMVPISERDAGVVDLFEGIHADAEANGVLSLNWDDINDDNVALVEIWRPDMDKWSALAGGDWNPELDSWGQKVATIPVGPAQWIDPDALVLDDNRYILRTVDFNGEISHGFVVEARPAVVFRSANWSTEDTNGVGTHDIDGEYVNVRSDDLESVLFMANRGELATLSYASKDYGGKQYLEVFFKSGVHAGERGWVAKDFLRWSVLEVCANDVNIRTGDNLSQIVGTASRGTQAYIINGQVRNTGQHRYFEVNAGGLEGWIATDYLCPKGTGGASGGGSNGGSGYDYDAALAKRLADEAYAGSIGYSMGRCYEYAWNAMKRAIGITETRANQLGIPATSAYQFGDWADANPSALYNDFGLRAIDSTASDAPVGSVVVWDRGQCGFSALHGHIEIVASPGYACSDFCGYMYDSCGKPRVYMPVE